MAYNIGGKKPRKTGSATKKMKRTVSGKPSVKVKATIRKPSKNNVKKKDIVNSVVSKGGTKKQGRKTARSFKKATK